MKTLNFFRYILCIAAMVIAFGQSAKGVVSPGTVDNQASAQIKQKLNRVNIELREIAFQMEREKDIRIDAIRNLEKILQQISQEENGFKDPYCSGKVAWALHQTCSK